MFDLNELMKRAQEMKSQMQSRMESMSFIGNAGGDGVRVVINGKKELTKIEISEKAAQDHEILADLVLAAMNSAYAQADDALKDNLSDMMGGMDLSAFGNLFNK